MKPRDILKVIADNYPLIVRTEHHAQIELGDGRKHDFWIADQGYVLKVKLAGQRSAEEYESVNQLRSALDAYSYEQTDLADLKRMERLVALAKGMPGVWVDAGWKRGVGKIAVIATYGNGFDAHMRTVETDNSLLAEKEAIALAKRLYPEAPIIFTDCKSLASVEHAIQWVPRENNKAADRIGNMRGHQ